MLDTTATASPLANMAAGSVDALPSYMDMFIGNIPGCLGETSPGTLIGGIYLIARKVISPIIPVTYIGPVFVLSAILDRILLLRSSAAVCSLAPSSWQQIM